MDKSIQEINRTMKLSIIISVFNLEKYITKCINSFLNQDIPTDIYEIIIIDDGSTDNSSKLIKDYVSGHHNISYYFKENGGASSARNLGLKYAKGEYIWFFDGDDWVKSNILKTIINKFDKYKTDIIFLNYEYINEENKILYKTTFTNHNKQIFNGLDFFDIAPGDFIMPHRFIIKRDFIINNKITFIEGITFEDDEWAPRILYHTKSCYVIMEPIYFYLKRGNSLMSSFNLNKIPSFLKVIESLKNFRDNIVSDENFKIKLNIYILTYISNYLRFRNNRRITSIDDIKKLKQINAIFPHGLTFTKKIQYLLIKHTPYLYSKIFAIK